VNRLSSIEHEFVELMPKALREGVLYISIEYATTVHLCYCGCESRVVAPLSPAQWNITFDGETVTLSPSVGSHDLACGSHYWIRKNQIQWSKPWTFEQVAKGRAADRREVAQHFNGKVVGGDPNSPPRHPIQSTRLSSTFSWLSSMFSWLPPRQRTRSRSRQK
jgi:hypothetical protein